MALTSLVQLVKTFDRHPAWRQQQLFQQLLAAWPDIVGGAVAMNAQPIEIRRQRLVVATISPVWAQTLTFERHHILKKLQQRLPKLPCSDIQFSPAQWHGQPAASATELPIWQQHPSRAKPGKARSPQKFPQSASEAFQAWQQQVRSRSQGLPSCPRCGCATPAGELERWSLCSLCVAQDWSNPPR